MEKHQAAVKEKAEAAAAEKKAAAAAAAAEKAEAIKRALASSKGFVRYAVQKYLTNHPGASPKRVVVCFTNGKVCPFLYFYNNHFALCRFWKTVVGDSNEQYEMSCQKCVHCGNDSPKCS